MILSGAFTAAPELLGALADKDELLDAILRVKDAMNELAETVLDIVTDFPRAMDLMFYQQLYGSYGTKPDIQDSVPKSGEGGQTQPIDTTTRVVIESSELEMDIKLDPRITVDMLEAADTMLVAAKAFGSAVAIREAEVYREYVDRPTVVERDMEAYQQTAAMEVMPIAESRTIEAPIQNITENKTVRTEVQYNIGPVEITNNGDETGEEILNKIEQAVRVRRTRGGHVDLGTRDSELF